MKKVIVIIVSIILVVALVIGGIFLFKGNNNEDNAGTLGSEPETKKHNDTKTEDKKTENNKEDLPNWRGIKDHTGYTVVGEGTIAFDIKYPSLKPASSGCAYQMDPALVLVQFPGLDSNFKEIKVESLEETFITSKKTIINSIEYYRDYQYKNFDFVIETQELMTINDLDVCKYIGKHTYTYDGEAQEIPFVAYSVDTKQVKNFYPTILVMDDSINHSSMDPLPKGTIEAYARKMVESIEISD